jgi:oligoendopeptidase F
MSSQTLAQRSEVPVEETWNLESIFATIEEWQAAIHQVEGLIPEIEEQRGKLGESAQSLAKGLETTEKLLMLGMKIYVYTGLATSVDIADQGAAARFGQGLGILTKAQTAIAFVDPEIMAIGFDTLEQWVVDEPKLNIYAHYFEQLKLRSEHIRSAEVEEVIALTYDALPPRTTLRPYSSLINADLQFKSAIGAEGQEMEVGQSSIDSLITHTDREIRRSAWENYADAYLDFRNTIASIQTMVIQRDVLNMRVRGFDSSLQASLKPNNIPEEVFHNLISVFEKNLPTWHRYWRIRRKALRYDSFHVYDIKAPISESKYQIPYDQAVDWIAEGMAPLGQEYVDILRRGCSVDRWVDRARNKGKRQGAFSWGSYDTQPFIMMSYADDVFSLSTLAHELGHSMHSYYTRKTQPAVYSQYTLFVAEVASNFNQALVRDYLFRTQDDPVLQLALVEEAMSNYHRYFFIMPTLARWELEMHRRVEQGEPVSAQGMIDLAAGLFKEGYADEVEFDHERIGISWAQFGHMYMDFYVYQYATGIAGANALADGVLQGKPDAAEKYLDFLKAGNSKYPLDALKMAGVDMTSPEPVEKAFAVLTEYVDRFEELVS